MRSGEDVTFLPRAVRLTYGIHILMTLNSKDLSRGIAVAPWSSEGKVYGVVPAFPF